MMKEEEGHHKMGVKEAGTSRSFDVRTEIEGQIVRFVILGSYSQMTYNVPRNCV
jgi:hypothetical protein